MEEDDGGRPATCIGRVDQVRSPLPPAHSAVDDSDLANTQPFLTEAADLAFCHNGLFADYESYRAAYAERLAGVADSEIGFCMLRGPDGVGRPRGRRAEQ